MGDLYAKVFDRQNRRVRGLWLRNGIFYAQVCLNGSPKASKVRLKADTVATAKTEMESLKQQRGKGTLEIERQRGVARFSDVATTYLTTMRTLERKHPNTIQLEGYSIKALGRFLGHKPVNQIIMADTTAYAAWRKVNPGRSNLKTVSGRIIDLDIIVLRHVMDFAREQGHIKANPIGKWRKLAGKPKEVRLLATAEVNQLIEQAAANLKCGKLFANYLRVLATSGGRYREALRLRWTVNVDWANRRLGFGQDGLSKFGKKRWVQFNPELETVLKEMHADRKPECDWLFPSYYHPGQPIKRFNGALAAAKKLCKIEGRLGFHHFRHYFISVCCMSGIDLMTIKEWVGHEDVDLIARIYGHLSDQHRINQAAKVNFHTATAPANNGNGATAGAGAPQPVTPQPPQAS